jgi:hypothetical protein
MSHEPHLPGYTVDDDDGPHGDPPTFEPEGADDVVLVYSSAGVGDPVRSAPTTGSSPSPRASTQPTPVSPSQQQANEGGDATAANTVTPTLPERPAVDDFADPKIAPLHVIFPDYDAALL